MRVATMIPIAFMIMNENTGSDDDVKHDDVRVRARHNGRCGHHPQQNPSQPHSTLSSLEGRWWGGAGQDAPCGVLGGFGV